jgi:hypothetical protein
VGAALMLAMRLPAYCILVTAIGVALHAQQRLVGPLQDQGIVHGCSWSASSPEVGPGHILLAEYDESVIVMNIGGRDVRLELDAASDAGRPRRVGETVMKVYTGDGIRVDATYTAVWVCPQGQEGCEVTRYAVTFLVRSGDAVESVDAAAEVGC